MRRQKNHRSISALGLGLGLALAGADAAWAQSGSSLSSGSGSGTGTGSSAGSFGSTGTGREAGGLGSTGSGMEGLNSGFIPYAPLPPQGLTRPIDRRPFEFGERGSRPSSVPPELLAEARDVADPGERSLALIRIAQAAIFSNQFPEARSALFEAAPAALAVQSRLVREQRTVAVIEALMSLAEERMRDIATPPASVDPILPPDPAKANDPLPPMPSALPEDDRRAFREAAISEWDEAVAMALRLENPTARSETLFRIAESQAFSSQRLITDPIRLSGGRPDPGRLNSTLREYTDQLLARSARTAMRIERPIWRDAASYTVVANAAASSQFPRGFEIARSMAQPEARTNALIRLAEGQALNNRPEEATAAYSEAATSVAMIPQDDTRETLVGVLVDSLISYGRFDDARAAVTIYAVPARRLTALSAIAQSQGRRGLAESARAWIAREAPPEYRAQLYRKVSDGVLASIEQNRSKDLTIQGQ
ncbi:hypothetical protein TA3x_000361 [Tundrisphaera sp. TA3]|uniref:hypothetical protein n=1 Tax=Tundrisphaera sp. TA3 TaxID=3435775 RepID=UPI003EB7CF9E